METMIDCSDRNEVIAQLKKSLKARSSKNWSVKGGKGTSYGWITISGPAKRLNVYGYMSEEDRKELSQLLGVDKVHQQGEKVPSSNQYYREYLDRAAGRTPSVVGTPYWD